jgi:hypothetical protein
VENRASDDSGNPWVSVPVDDQDLSQGFKDITFRQLNNYANHAAKWLSTTETRMRSPCFTPGMGKISDRAMLLINSGWMRRGICKMSLKQRPYETICVCTMLYVICELRFAKWGEGCQMGAV